MDSSDGLTTSPTVSDLFKMSRSSRATPDKEEKALDEKNEATDAASRKKRAQEAHAGGISVRSWIRLKGNALKQNRTSKC
jgi:hypothetical protein